MRQAQKENIEISKHENSLEIPFHLLLLADPSKAAIDKYIHESTIYVAAVEQTIVGVLVLYPVSEQVIEIKNIAVDENYQRRGIGKQMLQKAVSTAIDNKYETIIIGTGNSSIHQLFLYQQQGFELYDIRFNFFTDNYPEPIFEDGIQCRHMLMLRMNL